MLTVGLKRYLAPRSLRDLLLLAFGIYLLTLFLFPPPLEHLNGKYESNTRWKAISAQVNGVYATEDYDVVSHESKLAFRILPPALARLTFSSDIRVHVLFLYFFQLACGYAFVVILLQGLYQVFQDWLLAVFSTSGIMLTHIGSSFTYDLAFFMDGIAFFLMAVAMFDRRYPVYFLAIFLSFWVDERAVLGALSVLLFKWLTTPTRWEFSPLLRNRFTGITLLAIGAYLVIRVALIQYLAFRIPIGDEAGVGMGFLFYQVNHLPLAWFLTFKVEWFFIFPLLTFLWKKSPVYAALCLAFVLIMLFLSGIVADIMRSVSYIYPLILAGMVCADELYTSGKFRQLLTKNTIWCLFIPSYRYFVHFFLVMPVPIRIVQYFLQP